MTVRPAIAEVLDDAEQVVPPTGIEPARVVAQLVQDFVHLERGRDGFDQHRGADGAVRDARFGFGKGEDVIPKPRLEVALQLGQVVVRAMSVVDQELGQMKEVQPEIDQGADAGLAVEKHVPQAGASRGAGSRRRPAARRFRAGNPCPLRRRRAYPERHRAG